MSPTHQQKYVWPKDPASTAWTCASTSATRRPSGTATARPCSMDISTAATPSPTSPPVTSAATTSGTASPRCPANRRASTSRRLAFGSSAR